MSVQADDGIVDQPGMGSRVMALARRAAVAVLRGSHSCGGIRDIRYLYQ